MDAEYTPERPTLAAEITRAVKSRERYWWDYRGHQGLEPRSTAYVVAANITDTDMGSIPHTAAWLMLVLATHPSTPLVGKVGSRITMGQYLAAATSAGPRVGVTSRFKQLQQITTIHRPEHSKVVNVLTDLLRSGAQETQPDHRPDPALLCADVRSLLSGADRARNTLRGWHRTTSRSR